MVMEELKIDAGRKLTRTGTTRLAAKKIDARLWLKMHALSLSASLIGASLFDGPGSLYLHYASIRYERPGCFTQHVSASRARSSALLISKKYRFCVQ